MHQPNSLSFPGRRLEKVLPPKPDLQTKIVVLESQAPSSYHKWRWKLRPPHRKQLEIPGVGALDCWLAEALSGKQKQLA